MNRRVHMKTAGQIVGIFALLVAIYSFQQRERKGILFFQTISCILFTTHFLLLGAYTGAAFNLIGLGRCLVFYHRGQKKWASSPIWLAVFFVLIMGTVVATWDGVVTLFPTAAMFFTTVSLWVSKARFVRLLSLPSSPLWLIYNLINRSYAGILTESFMMVSILIAIVRFDILGIKEPEPNNT
jgi:hypothetical protein